MSTVGFPVYVFAGGRSSRFGVDKARVAIHQQPQLCRLIAQLRAYGYRVEVVADAMQRYADLGVACLKDFSSTAGPAAALLAAMQHRQTCYGEGWLLCLGCDQFLWRDSWLRRAPLTSGLQLGATSVQAMTFEVAEQAGGRESPGLRQDRRKTQPLPALYHSSILASLSEFEGVPASDVSLKSLLSHLRVVALPVDEHPQAWSFNTREELEQLMRKEAMLVESKSKT